MAYVTLRFKLGRTSALDMVDWSQVEQVFTQQRWVNLQKLIISWYGSDDIRPAVGALIRARLPILARRGVLDVQC
jgi:hypothetical protein